MKIDNNITMNMPMNTGSQQVLPAPNPAAADKALPPDYQASGRMPQAGQYENVKQAQNNNNDNNKTKNNSNSLQDTKAIFAVDDQTKSVVVRVLDKEGKIVRQYPPEEYLSMRRKMDEIVKNIYSKTV